MSVSIHSTLIPDTEWVLNDEKTVKWEWNEEEEISKGLTLVRNFPSKLPSVLHLNSVQSDNFLIPCRRDLILFTFSHQKWRNDPGMVDQNIKFDKNIKFDWNFQKLTKMSTVDKNVKFDKNINLTKMSNLTKISKLTIISKLIKRSTFKYPAPPPPPPNCWNLVSQVWWTKKKI